MKRKPRLQWEKRLLQLAALELLALYVPNPVLAGGLWAAWLVVAIVFIIEP